MLNLCNLKNIIWRNCINEGVGVRLLDKNHYANFADVQVEMKLVLRIVHVFNYVARY